jgi:hypothetical protein
MATTRRTSPDFSMEEERFQQSYKLGHTHATRSRQGRREQQGRARTKATTSRAKTARKAEARKERERVDKNKRAAQSQAQREKDRITRLFTAQRQTAAKNKATNARAKAASASNQTAQKRVAESEKLRASRERAQAQRAQSDAQRQSLQQARFLQGQENTRAKESRARRAAPVSSPSSTVGSGQGSGATPFALDRGQTAKWIILIIVICTVAAAVHDVKNQTPDITQLNVNGQTVRIPQHLRSVGAVLVMGTVALIVNEVDAGIGLVLGFGLLFLNINEISGMVASVTNFFAPKTTPATPAATGSSNRGVLTPPPTIGAPGGAPGGATEPPNPIVHS